MRKLKFQKLKAFQAIFHVVKLLEILEIPEEMMSIKEILIMMMKELLGKRECLMKRFNNQNP